VTEFDQLTDDFDSIVYGQRPADASHDSAAQQRWPQVQRVSKEHQSAKEKAEKTNAGGRGRPVR
jgi:hypothetical protein